MPEPILEPDELVFYSTHAKAFVEDQIIWPARKALGDISIVPDQAKMLDAISEEPRVAIESGHGSGKSSALSWIGIWWLSTRYNTLGHMVKVPVVAPTHHQIADVIWPEFHRWLPMSRVGPMFEWNDRAVYVKGHRTTIWARARSPQIPGHLQGNHADHLLWLIDEAFGITDKIAWETIEGSITQDDNKMIIGGQHSTIVGYVHDAFNRDKDNWFRLRFNSEKSPLVKKAYILRIARRYGKESDIYRVRVLGLAPRGNPESFLSLEQVERARAREVTPSGRLYMGVDCARFGDDMTVVTVRMGNHVFPQRSLAKSDTDQIVKLVLETLQDIRTQTKNAGVCEVVVDTTGGYGSGAVDALAKKTSANIRVVPVNFGGPGDEEFHDATSVMWGELRAVIDEIQLPNDEDSEFLAEELASRRIMPGFDRQGRTQVEPKSRFKTEYGVSPDRSDSLILCMTRKAAAKRVWNTYVATNPEHHREFPIAWKELEPQKFQAYVVLVREKDTGISVGCYFWGRETRRLYVYGEVCDPNPVVQVLAANVKTAAVLPLEGPSRLRVTKVFGDDEMFKGGDDLPKLLRKQGVRVYQNKAFDHAGGIALMNQMFARDQVVCHTNCAEHDRQFRTWTVVSGRPAAGYPLCLGISMIAWELKEHHELVQPMPLKAYGKRKQQIRRTLRGEAKPGVKRRQYDYLLP